MVNRLTSITDALAHLLGSVQPHTATENIALPEALGRILAGDVTAAFAVPAFDNSAMDGYAVDHRDCINPGAELRISQSIKAGHPGSILEKATAARIFTGAPMPLGATAVVMQENTEQNGEAVTILQSVEEGENLRRAGHDIAADSRVLARGHRLQPQDLGLLASLGITRLEVLKPLTAALLNTGDELKEQGQPLSPGELYDSNSFTLAALLQQLGMNVIKLGIVRDDPEATKRVLQDASQLADCIITTGGVSVGEADYVRQAVEELGQISLWKLAIKPGKPFSFGNVGKVPFFGLPGNPVAVFITFVVLVKPYLLSLQGATGQVVPPLRVKAGFTVDETGARQEYLRVKLKHDAENFPVARLFADQSSSVLTSLSWADGLVIIPVNTRVQSGQLLDYLPFAGLL